MSEEKVTEERILVLAPLGRDAEVICERLESAGFSCRPCRDMDDLQAALAIGAGAVVLTEEILTEKAREMLLQAMAAQPVWSDLPVTLLLSAAARGSHDPADVQAILPGRNVTILRRPVPTSTLVSLTHAALLARRRQYEVREHLKERLRRAEELEQRVRKRTEQVRQLAAQFTLAEQAERHRISQVLHDDVQQRLFSLKIQTTILESTLAEGSLDAAQAEIEEIKQGLDKLIEITRSLSVDLSPAILYNEGLTEALSWLADQMQKRYGLTVEIEANDSFMIRNDGLRVLLFQIVRELLFNVVKHADATFATVTLERVDGRIRMQVSDEGRGFDVETVLHKQEGAERALLGYGLQTIRHRLDLFDGRVEIDSRVGGGTRVVIDAPMNNR